MFAGLIAANLPGGSEVLTATGDFTSILFPFYAQSGRGIRVREVPLDRIAECVTSRTTLVAVSAVQSADGQVADLDALHAASRATGARVLLDTTQAVGWLPVDAGRFAYTACGGYKWLLSPRGTAYFTINPALIDDLTPHYAGWYAGDDPWSSIYGGPLRLASDARRFDVSPAWHAWVAAAPALRLLAQVGTQSLHRHALGLANRFRAEIGLEPGDSAIVSLATSGAAADAMAAARITGSARAAPQRQGHRGQGQPDDERPPRRAVLTVVSLTITDAMIATALDLHISFTAGPASRSASRGWASAAGPGNPGRARGHHCAGAAGRHVAGVPVTSAVVTTDFSHQPPTLAEQAYLDVRAAHDVNDHGYSEIMCTRPDTIAAAVR